jgi:hypothetical protein
VGAVPVPLVVAVVGLTPPQAAPLVVKMTVSPARLPPPVLVTVAVTVEVALPSAGILVGLAAALIEAAPAAVCVTVAEPLPKEGSVPVMVQKPVVVDAV